MSKNIIALIVVSFITISGVINISYAADTSTARVSMQKHIEKMKRTKPREYQQMFKEANGNIVSCLSCHKDLMKKPSK